MREIKFRVYCFADDKKQMIVLENGQFDNGYWFNCPAKIVHIDEYLSPLMQFTGLKDKNKNEVYHKDYVLSGKKRFIVEWQQEEARFILLPCLGNPDNWKFMDEVSHMKLDGNLFETKTNG